jgi:hypothetical protein
MKIVINTSFGGFCLSKEAYKFLGLECKEDKIYDLFDNDRTNPKLIECVEQLGEAASGPCSELKIVEIPDGVQYTIEDYDGMEHIAELHRTWR